VSTKAKPPKKKDNETIRSEVYEDGNSVMGVSHYRRRKTTHEVTATSENGVHVPGQNFFST